MTDKQFNDLLDRYLQGETTPEEEKILRDFEDFAISQTEGRAFKSGEEQRKIKKEIYRTIKARTKKSISKWKWMRVAASLAILLGLAGFFYNTVFPRTIVIANTTETFKVATLEDGSRVTLNTNSSLRFANDYKGIRQAELEGEAFFEVARNEQKPFVVQTGHLSTKVLGTSFNIKQTDSAVHVTVATGLVQVSDADNAVQLSPNQKVVYDTRSKSLQRSEIDHNLYTSWYKEKVEFKGVKMTDLAVFLQKRYGVNIHFLSTDIEAVQMTLSISKDETLAEVIDKINYITELELTKTPQNEIEAKFKNQ
ncbi:FecR domain-containing protein [Maribacter sp. MMG018]|uniref:FecR family protein n=1 Tax=Maribacter sp. MMG018 TaxID=2822688 RepID=UPI001B384437|nr:FecR family protein [Maribacter sp. MMG018]MBQ4915876.1 FecR domain-containing protein [Maribacter sp. MMG018]